MISWLFFSAMEASVDKKTEEKSSDETTQVLFYYDVETGEQRSEVSLTKLRLFLFHSFIFFHSLTISPLTLNYVELPFFLLPYASFHFSSHPFFIPSHPFQFLSSPLILSTNERPTKNSLIYKKDFEHFWMRSWLLNY